MEEENKYKKAAEALWQYLDDISTANDQTHTPEAYKSLVESIHKKRWAILTTRKEAPETLILNQ